MLGVVTELKTWPQILSTHTTGIPDWVVGSLVLVAHGIVIQSVMHWVNCQIHTYNIYLMQVLTEVPTTLPRVGEPPVTEKAWGGVLASSGQAVY